MASQYGHYNFMDHSSCTGLNPQADTWPDAVKVAALFQLQPVRTYNP
jgi:hypothetical protein